ncbi:MAG: S8 family serine peptidase [Proteobacteria bacterium]|nr:S8 family serine peptidase [Pseudomonadota bacterium]
MSSPAAVESRPGRALVVGFAATLAAGFIAVSEYAMTRFAAQTGGRLVELHVKAIADEHLVTIAGSATSPLFSHAVEREADAWRDQWVRVFVPADDVASILGSLASDPTIEDAFVAPTIGLPVEATPHPQPTGDRCPLKTPSFETYQGYVGPAPQGIDAPAAWQRGVRGQGVWFADIEGGWNAQHEDLPGDRIRHVGGTPIRDRGWREHGTAVLGEVVGRANELGVVGLAPDVERVFTSSIGGTTVADAIDVAAQALRPGDVLLVRVPAALDVGEPHTLAAHAALPRGGRVARSKRDPGAIMLGAGGPPRPGYTDRARLDFSNYGGRVDVQGWGRKVATLDYGDLQACDAPGHRHYTNEFSGTSSASPIVAGAAVLVESAARVTDRVIAPRALRALLTETGTPQVGAQQHIGPRPDLAKALRSL